MIEYMQRYIITNDDPIALGMREHLLDDGWQIVSEDTKQTTYQKHIWCKETVNEQRRSDNP